jgi:predicted transcriptional regulator
MDRDDILTDSTKSMLRMLLRPLTAQEIAASTTMPLKEIENQLHEFLTGGLVAAYKGCYVLTDKGRVSIDLAVMQYN